MHKLKLYFFNFLQKTNNQTLFSLCLLFLFIVFIVFRFLIVFSYSSDIVIGEDNNVWNIQKMLLGNELYTNPESYPFEIFQYAPLSQYFTFYTAKLLSYKVGDNVHGLFVLGRVYSLIFNILTSFVIFRFNIVFLNISKNVNLVLSFLSLFIITYIDYTLRADSLSNLFIIISLYWFFKTLESDQLKFLVYTVLFSLLAVFSKQNAIQILVYFFTIYLFIKPKRISNYILILITFSALFCLFFYVIYGNLFFYCTIVGISNPTQLTLGISLFFDYTKRYGILLFLSLLTIFLKNDNNKESISNYIKILLFIFISSFIFSFGTSQKIGAGLNYYTLNIYISVLLSAVFIDRIYNSEMIKLKYLFLVLIVVSSSGHLFIERMYNRHIPQISVKHKQEYATDLNFVREVKKRIGVLKNQNYIFTPNKNIKNLYFYNTVLPNTEYYGDGASRFNWSKFDKNKLKYIIINENDSYILNHRTFHQFHINLSDYSLIYSYKNRKLLCLNNLK